MENSPFIVMMIYCTGKNGDFPPCEKLPDGIVVFFVRLALIFHESI